ncbi:MAG: efflux RND transporter periplasmic adaptor subunit [Elusimicrobia bacterium]|nr:efflux RND transporter periplasmic adaptor subunit [Elusimicrobiota bacterium]
MGKRKKIILIVGAVIIAIILVRAARFFISKPKRAAIFVPVKTVKSVYKNLEELLELTGDVRGLSEAKVYSKVPGKLQEKKKDVGDIVSKNDAIALVDRDEPAFEYKLSEVNSPINGVITQYFLDIGEAVTPQNPVFEVASIDKIKITANITEEDIPKIKKGLPVRFTVDAYPEKTFYGDVSKISQSINLQTRTAQIEIAVSNEGMLLKPGMFAKIELILSVHKNVLSIPTDSVGETDSQKYVYVIKNAVAYKKMIKTGILQNNFTEILEGVLASDDVVSVGWQNLSDGVKVEVVQE